MGIHADSRMGSSSTPGPLELGVGVARVAVGVAILDRADARAHGRPVRVGDDVDFAVNELRVVREAAPGPVLDERAVRDRKRVFDHDARRVVVAVPVTRNSTLMVRICPTKG